MVHMTQAKWACVQCWNNSEYFMLKHCVETMFGNNGEGLLQACISSIVRYYIVAHLFWKSANVEKINVFK
jgi:hypothetical protein